MRMRITDYRIGDEVDVYAFDGDEFHDFCGVINSIDMDNNECLVLDEEGDNVRVSVQQIRLKYSEETENEVNYYE